MFLTVLSGVLNSDIFKFTNLNYHQVIIIILSSAYFILPVTKTTPELRKTNSKSKKTRINITAGWKNVIHIIFKYNNKTKQWRTNCETHAPYFLIESHYHLFHLSFLKIAKTKLEDVIFQPVGGELYYL